MSTVSLQTVFDEARQAIEAGAADKAIGIAQHVLAHYPRMIEGLRLLGEAQLNAGQPEQAADSFERVLQADPENVAAYYGLGLARQSTEQRAAAITAFERALEIQPNLADLRTQLMRLYSETPGSAGQFRLSRAGLGRLYARGGMFGQAIDEFRAVLDADPARDDVKVALAEALWRDGQEDEAADYCRDLLDQQPDLLKPTVLLGYMQFANGQPEGEALWRRAAEQDAQMVLPRTLFDILPPIRIEEPVLPEFDEAEWRAQEARRVAVVEPAIAAPVAVADDDDFFADSWLGATGAVDAQADVAQSYDEVSAPVQAAHAGDGDDDLLASLLGFGSFDESSPAVEQQVADDVQPFTLGDWANEPEHAKPAPETTSVSLEDIGLEDAGGNVKPFSLEDDWEFDQPSASAEPPVASAQDDVTGVAAFSLDDLDNDDQAVKPFSFESNDDELGDVKPFSLDDDFGTEPFSFESASAGSSAEDADVDAGLGDVKPFSLDEWGLDDEQSSAVSAESIGSAEGGDLGDLKPFSLDELSLDSLDAESPYALSGPSIDDENETTTDEPSEFKWQEPSWRSQTTSAPPVDTGGEEESIFAKLLRNRPADASAVTPAPSDQQVDNEDTSFFSLDDETLRLEDDSDDFPGSSSTLAQTDDELSSTVGLTSSSADLSLDAGPTPFSLDDLGLDDRSFATFDDQSELTTGDNATRAFEATETPDDATLPFSLDELGLDDDTLSNLDQQPGLAADMSDDRSADTTPFSLDDLGLDEPTAEPTDVQPFALDAEGADDLVVRDVEPSNTSFSWDELSGGDQTSEQGVEPANTFSLSDLGLDEDFNPLAEQATTDTGASEPEMSPFSLSELGLTDDEIAALNIDDVGGELDRDSFGGSGGNADGSVFNPEEESDSAAEPEMVPFSLSELGLTDDEIALLDQESTASGEQSLADIFGDDVDMASHDVSSATVDEKPTFTAAGGGFDEGGDAAGVEQPAPASVDAPEMVPFSLADLGLSEDELALFEDAPTGESSQDDTYFAAEPQGGSESVESAAAVDAFAEFQMEEAAFEAPSSAESIEEHRGSGAEDSTESSDEAVDLVVSAQEQNVYEAPTVDESFASAPTEPLVAPDTAPEPAVNMAASVAGGGLAAIFAQLDRDPNNDTLRLAVARMSQQTDQSAQALDQYKHLIKRGHLLDDVVDDLHDAIADTDDPHMLRRLHRLLGDAYMKQNRFREAMDEYSWTLARS